MSRYQHDGPASKQEGHLSDNQPISPVVGEITQTPQDPIQTEPAQTVAKNQQQDKVIESNSPCIQPDVEGGVEYKENHSNSPIEGNDEIVDRSEVVDEHKICQHFDASGSVKCKGHRTGLLTGEEIKKLGIIEDLDEDCLQATSYDLRLGEGHMLYDATVGKERFIWVGTEEAPNNVNPTYDSGNAPILKIPAFGMVLIQLKENINLIKCIERAEQPVMVCGHFDLKLSLVSKGIISQQATQVEPGYNGKLFCHLFNLTAEDIELSYTDPAGSKVATIEFQYVSCTSQCNENLREEYLGSLPDLHKKYDKNVFCIEHGIKDVRYFAGMPNGVKELPKRGALSSLNNRINEVKKLAENAQENVNSAIKEEGKNKGIFGGAIGVLLAALVGVSIGWLNTEDFIKEYNSIQNGWDSIKAEYPRVNSEVQSTSDALHKLREDSQETYEKTMEALIALDQQKKRLELGRKTQLQQLSKTSSVNTAKGGNQ